MQNHQDSLAESEQSTEAVPPPAVVTPPFGEHDSDTASASANNTVLGEHDARTEAEAAPEVTVPDAAGQYCI